MSSKFYFYLVDKIKELESKLSSLMQARLTQCNTSNLFYFSIIRLNLSLIILEILSDVVKFFVILFADPAQGFRLFYNQRDLQACPYSYTGFRQVQKKIRTFSLAGMGAMIFVAVTTSLITNLIFGGKLPGQAASYAWLQSTWSSAASTTAIALHLDQYGNSDQTGWATYSSKDSSIVTTGAATGTIQVLVQYATNTQSTSDDFNATGTVNASTVVSGSGAGASVQLQKIETANGWAVMASAPAVTNIASLAYDGNGNVYGFAGNGTTAFWQYNIASNTWATKANAPAAVTSGGLAYDGNGNIFGLRGINTTQFWKYNIAANTWTAMASAPLGLNGSTITYDNNGNMFVSRGNGQLDFWKYNIAANTWTAMANTPNANSGGGAAYDSNGNIFLLSGNGSNLFWKYNIATNAWSTMANAPAGVSYGLGLIYDGNGNIYGSGGGGTTFWKYNIAANTWTAAADTPAMVSGGAMASDGSGHIFGFAGNTTNAFWRYSLYDSYPTSGTFTSGAIDLGLKSSLTSLNFNPGSSASGTVQFQLAVSNSSSGPWSFVGADGTASTYFATSGQALPASFNGYRYLRYKAFLASSGTKWVTMPDMPSNMNIGGDIVYDNNGNIFAFRGANTNNFWKYNLAAGSWSVMAPAPAAVYTGGSLVYDYNGNIFAFTGNASAGFYKYSIATNVWSAMAAAPATLGGYDSALTYDMNGNIFALRGAGTAEHWKYNIASNTWATMASAPTVVYNGASLTYNNNGGIYAIGNGNPMWRYNITANNWTALANLGWVDTGAIIYDNNGGVYWLQGKYGTSFWRYNNISNVWTAMSPTPAVANGGGSLTYDNNGHVYASRGANTPTLWRYSVRDTFAPSLDDVSFGMYAYPASSTLTSSWYDTTDAVNTISRINWTEIASVASGTNVKFQIRTAPASSSNPIVPDIASAWQGPDGTPDTYFSASSIGCTKDGSGVVSCLISATTTTIADSSNDQWMQYRVILESSGDNMPTVDDINLQYVVNNAPDFLANSLTAFQSTSTGMIEVAYAVRDSDTDAGSVNNQYKANIGLEYWNGASWVSASSSLLAHNTGTSSVAVSTSSYNSYSFQWDAKSEEAITNQLLSDLGLRIVVNDGEVANNLGYATTSTRVDLKNPATGSSTQPLVLDSRQATSAPSIVYLDQTDDSPLYYKISGDAAMSGVADWMPYQASTTLDIQNLGTTSVYVLFKDEYNNYSPTIRVVQTEMPGNAIIRDLTNADVGKYMEFVAWRAITNYNGTFKTYQIWRGEGTEETPPTDYLLAGTTTLNQVSKNYYLDENVVPGTTYYYKVAAEDMNGNISMFSPVLHDNPDGQGGTDNTPPTVSNVEIIASSTQSVTIAWETDELSSSYVGYSKNSGDFSTVVGYDTMADKDVANGGTMGRHVVTVSGLTPSTGYYFQVKSVDPATNIGTASLDPDNGNIELQFTTKPGPQISEIQIDYSQLTNTTAAIKWLTDVESDSVVVYSTNPDLSSPAEIQGLTGTTTSHEVKLDNLLPRTIYYFYVRSSRVVDGLVEEAYDKNVDAQGITQYYQFETTFDEEAPTISTPDCQLMVSSGTTTPGLIITATTSEPAVIYFAYGLATSSYDMEMATSSNYNIDQIVHLEDLLASTTYHFQITALDKSNNSRISPDFFCSTGEQLATQGEVEKAYKAGQAKGTADGLAEGKAQQLGGGTIIVDKTDKEAPTITDVQVNGLTATSAVISWVTNEEANGFIKYGPTFSYGKFAGFSGLFRNHYFVLDNLERKTQYHYQVQSADASGNLSSSADLFFITPDYTPVEVELVASSAKAETRQDKETLLKSVAEKAIEMFNSLASQVSLGTFENTVLSQYDALDKLAQIIPAPVLGGEPATEITPTTATISWKTDKFANSMVAYAPEGLYAPSKGSRGYLQLVGEPNQSTSDHTVKIVGLKPDTVYHYQLRSKARIGAEAISRNFTFRTKPEALEIVSVNTETLASDRAKFSWLTSQETDTQLTYIPYRNGRLSPDEIKIYQDKTFTANHQANINDLEAGVVYQFLITATDKKGVKIEKPINFFSTTKDDLPPEISDIKTESALSQSKESRVQTIMTWTTSEPTISQIKFAKGVFEDEKDLIEETPLETVYSRKHTIVITKFEIGEVYSFRVVATDSGGNQSVSSPHIVLTPKQKEGVFELIIKTFESTFGWLGQMK